MPTRHSQTQSAASPIRRVPVYHTPGGRKPNYVYGPGDPPAGFLGPQTTNDEWFIYWALARIFNDPTEPRRGPFFGGRAWGYQLHELSLFGLSGETAIDFLIFLPDSTIGIRVQTPYFHLSAGPYKTGYDDAQRRALSRRIVVRDIYSQDFIADRSGAAAIRLMVDTLGGRDHINPAMSGTYRVVRPNTL